jgi:glutathione S-transferase
MEEHAKPLGLPANQTEIADDGTVGRYTVPVLHDSSTGKAISDSTRIIEYLHEAYPDTPRIIHPETKTLAVAYEHTVLKNVVLHIYATITPRVGSFMSPEDEIKYREMVNKNAGVDHTELVANKEVVEGMWKKAEEGLTLLDGYFRMAKLKFGPESEGVKGGFLEGSKPALADFSLGGFLIWMKHGLGETDEQWKRIESWNDGRWAKYLDAMKPYSEIHE